MGSRPAVRSKRSRTPAGVTVQPWLATWQLTQARPLMPTLWKKRFFVLIDPPGVSVRPIPLGLGAKTSVAPGTRTVDPSSSSSSKRSALTFEPRAGALSPHPASNGMSAARSAAPRKERSSGLAQLGAVRSIVHLRRDQEHSSCQRRGGLRAGEGPSTRVAACGDTVAPPGGATRRPSVLGPARSLDVDSVARNPPLDLRATLSHLARDGRHVPARPPQMIDDAVAQRALGGGQVELDRSSARPRRPLVGSAVGRDARPRLANGLRQVVGADGHGLAVPDAR